MGRMKGFGQGTMEFQLFSQHFTEFLTIQQMTLLFIAVAR